MRVILLGHPVAHSLSPAIQNAAFAAMRMDHSYQAIDVPPAQLRSYVEMLRSGAYLGANVTVPHKIDVVPMLDEVDAEAKDTGAVNTIVVSGDRLVGHNTDVDGASEGLLKAVADSLLAARVLLLGAGGGARAVLVALARDPALRPQEIAISARRAEAAAGVVSLGAGLGLRCRAAAWSSRGGELRQAQVVINCTPLGLYGEDPLDGLHLSGMVVLDLAYRGAGTTLFERAWSEGAVALQGDQMLIHQGARSFELWTGVVAPVDAMREALAKALE